jgi:hypothetical protein
MYCCVLIGHQNAVLGVIKTEPSRVDDNKNITGEKCFRVAIFRFEEMRASAYVSDRFAATFSICLTPKPFLDVCHHSHFTECRRPW